MEFNESDARKFYGTIGHYPTEYTEVRVKDPQTGAILLHRNVKGEAEFIETIRPYWDKTVWAGLNPRKSVTGSKNEDIARRTAILIDLDIHHPDDTPATPEELEQKLIEATALIEKLKKEGHPRPWLDVSGNGVHLIFGVNLPAQPDVREKIREWYKSLNIGIDMANADLARMCRVPGTLNAKAGRMSYLVSAGDWTQDKALEAKLTNQTPTITQALQQANDHAPRGTGKAGFYLEKCRPCIYAMTQNKNMKAISQKGHLQHEAHLLIVKDAQYFGLGEDDICSLFTQQPDYDERITRDAVKGLMRDNNLKGVTPWTCSAIIERDWCIKNNDPKNCEKYLDTPRDAKSDKRRKPGKKDNPDAVKEERKDDKGAVAIDLAHRKVVEFFRDQYQTAYAVITVLKPTPRDAKYDTNDTKTASLETYMRENIYIDANTPRKEFPKLPSLVSLVSQNITVPIKSTRFKGWLAYEFLQETKETIGIQTLSSVCLVLEAETMSKPACTLYNRFAPDGRGGFYWDMADDDGRAIHVTPRGWMVKPAPLKMFRKFPHMMALPEPKQGGTLEAFLKYLNVYAANDKLLAVVAVISNLIPEVPRVGTVVTGVQGSGKSTWHRLMQNLLDPSSTDLLTMPSPQKDEDLSQILEHHAVALFDNVNTITRTQSDLLCRAITGAGYEKRELYTTDDSFIRRYIRIVGLNSISMPVEKGDLFSRVILLPWEQITDRKTDAEMQAMIQADVPGLMYCILNILVDAMKRHPSTSTSLNVRMSDFAKWGCAITEAIGLRKAVFEKAYRDNVRAQDEEAVRASLLAEMIIRYFTRNPNQLNIEGSSTDIKKLLEDFENPLDERGRPTGDLLSRREGWAKNTTRFGRDLTEVAHHLTNIGYKVVTPKTGGRGKTRNYIIERFAGVGGVERGQRRFDTVDPDELTETRLRDVLRVAGLTRISPDVSDVSDVSDVTNVSDVTPTPDANDANNANRDADTKDIKDVIDTNDANDTKISAPVGEGLYEKVLKDLSEMNWDEAVKDETLFEAIEEKHGVKRGATVKVVSTMVREGTLFMPRPGYYKFSGGSK